MCPVPGCQVESKYSGWLNRHIAGDDHDKKLSNTQIAEYKAEAIALFKNGRAAIKKAFSDTKATADSEI